MGTIQNKLGYLNDTKTLLKNAIEAKGVPVPDGTPFREYADLVETITGGGGGGYVVGEPAEVTIPVSSWNGTSCEPYALGYKQGSSGVQLGLPSDSSTTNTQAVVAAALTVTRVSTSAPDLEDNRAGRVNFRVSAIAAPTRDIKVAFFGLEEATQVMITQTAIVGVTVPVTGEKPVTTIDNEQFTGAITWSPEANSFAASTSYTATITLTPKPGFKLAGVPANSFTVEGATSVSNSASSGTVKATFPATAAA